MALRQCACRPRQSCGNNAFYRCSQNSRLNSTPVLALAARWETELRTSKTCASKASVLVVEDSPEIQRYFQFLLQLDGYRVTTASSGEEALLHLRRGGDPQVILLDIQMPGIGGLETLRLLRTFRPNMKVIMCSGLQDPDVIQQALSLGARGYLVKPVRHLYLSAAIEQCLMSEKLGGSIPASIISYPAHLAQPS